MHNRDIIVIGGSSGATAPLKDILGRLPIDLPAAVFIVLHVPSQGIGILATVVVVLSGLLSDGATGLTAIKQCGGLALVQDPADAIADEMPLRALGATTVDLCVPGSRIGDVLSELVREEPGTGLPAGEGRKGHRGGMEAAAQPAGSISPITSLGSRHRRGGAAR